MNYHWMHKLSAILFVVLCFEVGLFLLVFPWLEAWRLNSLAGFSPEWSTLWMNFHFRGAVSGLGLINIYISIAEAFRLRRFAPQPATSAGAPAEEAIDHNN